MYGYEDRIFRISHTSHRTAQQLKAELEFLLYLSDGTAAVSKPLPLPNGALVQQLGNFSICSFEKAASSQVETQFSDDLIQEWGRSIGMFHRLAKSFVAKAPRPSWWEDENHQFLKRIPGREAAVLNASDRLMSTLSDLPQTEDCYGLIHSDAHAGNFLVDGDQLTFFDFDDSLYAWFGYDLATILFGAVLQPWVNDSDRERNKKVLHERACRPKWLPFHHYILLQFL